MASPKTLLRLPAAVSRLSDLSEECAFRPLIDEGPDDAQAVVFCSGKFYYDLQRECDHRRRTDMAVVRIEELCPLPTGEIEMVVGKYKNAREYIWCQEEHRNMGPYGYINPRLSSLLPSGKPLRYAGRMEAAGPAAGYSQLHRAELAQIFSHLFAL